MKTRVYLLLFMFFCFIGCQEEQMNPVDGGNNVIVESKGVAGSMQKGPFISGSSVVIQELDSQFTATGVTFNSTTNNDFGGFQISSLIKSPFIEVITNGFYYDEVGGKISDANISLRAITNINDSTITNVNILTTLAKDRIIYLTTDVGLNYTEAKIQAQNEILNIFNIPQNDSIDFNDLDISIDGEENAILLAISIVLQWELSVGELSETISKIILDIKPDGELNDSNIIQTLYSNADNLDLKSVRNNLITRYVNINQDATIPPFEKYAKRLVPLRIESTSPEIGETEVPYNLDSITIKFNKEISQPSINNENIKITNSTGVPLNGTFSYDAENHEIVFIPEEELLPEEIYSVELSDQIIGIDDAHLEGGYYFEFVSLEVNIEHGLLAYYPFSNSFDDISGNGFNATGVNTSFTEDIDNNLNQACLINGEGSYLELPNVINITEPNWTYSIWFNLNELELETVAMLLGHRISGEAFWDLPLYIRSSNRYLTSYNGGILDVPFLIELDHWYHLAVVVENSTMSVYFNGNLIIKGDDYTPDHSSGDSSYKDFNGKDIGLFDYYNGKYYISEKFRNGNFPTYVNGTVDNVRFYNRAINKYEVLELFNLRR